MRRRDVVAGLGCTPLAACLQPCPDIALPGLAPSSPALIDGHCHLFNVKDLSAVRFITRVFLEQYPELARSSFVPEDPDALDLLVSVFLALVGAGGAPSAVSELKLLQGQGRRQRGEDASPRAAARIRGETVDRMAALLKGGRLGIDASAENSARALILESADDARSAGAVLTDREARAIATQVLDQGSERAGSAKDGLSSRSSAGGGRLGGFVNFITQLRRFRHCLVDGLTGLHRRGGSDPALLAPAMVDFGRWLRDDPEEGSTFRQQVTLWRQISRRKGGPAVHGYVGYCPLRQVQFDRGLLGPGRRIPTPCNEDSLGLVRDAITSHGFLGVKLYPPMGFRPTGNGQSGAGQTYPREVLLDVFGDDNRERKDELGRLLDDALERLYALCAEIGAPIIAHAASSNDAFENSGRRADPYYWRPVFERFPELPVMLAHFGGFEYRSADPEGPSGVDADGKVPFESTWEASLARYVSARPESPVFADISMFVELFDPARRDFLLQRFRQLDRTYPEFRRHLVFGTDWTMLATHPRAAEFDNVAIDFLTEAFGKSAIPNILHGNFLRFAGLGSGQRSRLRLETFHGADPVRAGRLRVLDGARTHDAF